MGDIIEIEGYSFTNEKMAKQAQKEAEGVRYVKARTDMTKPEQVFSVYHKLLAQQMFQTPVGYEYLKELQEYLQSMPSVKKRDIRPIPVSSSLRINDTMGISEAWRGRMKGVQRKLHVSVMANVILVLLVLVMFAITLSSDQTTILNYERKLQDRYAQWEQELTQREQIVREEEQMLDLQFDTLIDE